MNEIWMILTAAKKLRTWRISCPTATSYYINPIHTCLVSNQAKAETGHEPTAWTTAQPNINYKSYSNFCCTLFKVTSPYLSCSVGHNCSLKYYLLGRGMCPAVGTSSVLDASGIGRSLSAVSAAGALKPKWRDQLQLTIIIRPFNPNVAADDRSYFSVSKCPSAPKQKTVFTVFHDQVQMVGPFGRYNVKYT
jgi:hypothetical protein